MARICNKVCFTNYPVWNHWSMTLYCGKAFLWFQCLPVRQDVSTYIYNPWWSLDVLYKKPMYSVLFLGVGRATLANTMHHLLRTHYPNGYRFLKFDETWQTPETERRVKHLRSTPGRWTGNSRWEKASGSDSTGFQVPTVTCCVALRQHHRCQLFCEMGKPLALSRIMMSSW